MPESETSQQADPAAIAQEVIVSAGNVLRAAGFARAEIAAMFLQAAAVLGAGQAGAEATPALSPQAAVQARFAALPPVRELRKLGAEGQALLPLGPELVQLKPAFDLAMRLAPLLAEAQEALRGLAGEAGLPLSATHAEAAGADTVCLEDCASAYAHAFELVGALVDALVAHEDGEAFAWLLNHYAEHGVVIAGALQAALARGARLLG